MANEEFIDFPEFSHKNMILFLSEGKVYTFPGKSKKNLYPFSAKCIHFLLSVKRIESLCEVIEVRKNGESYYIKDLTTDRIYLRNRLWIKSSESSINEIHQAKNLKVKCDTTV